MSTKRVRAVVSTLACGHIYKGCRRYCAETSDGDKWVDTDLVVLSDGTAYVRELYRGVDFKQAYIPFIESNDFALKVTVPEETAPVYCDPDEKIGGAGADS